MLITVIRIPWITDRKNPWVAAVSAIFFVPCAKVIGNSGVDSDSEANGNGVDHVLDRIDKGQGGHGLLADLCHEEAVHNVV